MDLIVKLPTYDDGTINRALEREIRNGFELIKANQKREELHAAAQAHAMRGHKSIAGLGKAVAVVPEDEYFRLVKKYGHAEVHSKDFLRSYRRFFPDLCPNRV